jgi:hypothetical protein
MGIGTDNQQLEQSSNDDAMDTSLPEEQAHVGSYSVAGSSSPMDADTPPLQHSQALGVDMEIDALETQAWLAPSTELGRSPPVLAAETVPHIQPSTLEKGQQQGPGASFGGGMPPP